MLLHIGLPKTGTTYLQRTMHAASRAGALSSLQYPDVGYYNHQIALYVPLARHVPWRTNGNVNNWQRLSQSLHAEAEKPLLLSAEALASLDEAGVAECMRILAPNKATRIIVTARPLEALLPSHWQQGLKTGGRLRLDDYAARVLKRVEEREPNARMFSHEFAISTWREVLPDVPVTLLFMDGSSLQNLYAFADACGLSAAEAAALPAFVPPASRQNLSLSTQECEAMLTINARIARGDLEETERRAELDRCFARRDQDAAYDKPVLGAVHAAQARDVDERALAALSALPGVTVVHGTSNAKGRRQ